MVGMFRRLLGGGDSNERVLERMEPLIDRVNAIEAEDRKSTRLNSSHT